MIHADGTMDVNVNGKVERRKYSINRDAEFNNRYFARIQSRYMPETTGNERVFWTHTSDVPTIVQGPDEAEPPAYEPRHARDTFHEFWFHPLASREQTTGATP